MNDKKFQPYELPFTFTPEQIKSVASVKTEAWANEVLNDIAPKIPKELTQRHKTSEIIMELQKANEANKELLEQNDKLIRQNAELTELNNKLLHTVKELGKSHIIRELVLAIMTGVTVWLITQNWGAITMLISNLVEYSQQISR